MEHPVVIYRYRLTTAVLAVCLLLVTLGYQAARHQAADARDAAREERRYRVYFQDALSKLRAQRYDGVGGKRMVSRLLGRQREDQTYIAWLERELSRYEAGPPAEWRGAARRQEVKAFRAAWEAYTLRFHPGQR
jgi:hypothetical protein